MSNALSDLFSVTVTPHVQELAAKPSTQEKGSAGIPRWGGYQMFDEDGESSAKWRPPERWTTVAEMRHDPDVAAALDAVVLPLLAAKLTVVPGGKTSEDEDIAAFVENDLHHMSTSLHDFRFEALDGALGDGVAPFQKVYSYSEVDGRYHLRKLAYRPASTVRYDGWLVDEFGGPKGLIQRGLELGDADVEFDIEELLLFIHRRRGGNIVGESILRRMYAPYFFKQRLAWIGAGAVERHGIGLPTLLYSGNSSTERLRKMLEGLKAAAKGYALFTKNDIDSLDQFEIKGVDGAVLDPMSQLEYHRRSLYMSVFAQFIPLGTDGVGARALSEDQSSFFLMLLRAVAQMETDTYNRYLIPQWVGMNWEGIEESRLPKVDLGRLDQRDIAGWVQSVASLVQAGVFPTSDELRAMAHEMLDVPMPDPEETVQDGGELEGEEPQAPAELALQRPRLESEVKLEALGVDVDWQALASGLDETEKRLIERLQKQRVKEGRYLAKVGRQIIEKGDPTKLADVALDTGEAQAIFEQEFERLYGVGVAEVGRELGGGKKPDGEASAASKLLLAAAALEFASRLAERARTTWGAEVLTQLRTGQVNEEALRTAAAGASDKLLADVARQGASTALNIGRQDAGTANATEVETVLYSSVLDQNTCATCKTADGKEWAPGDPGIIECPNPDCDGGDRCRCVLVYISK